MIDTALDNIMANLPGHVYWKDRNGVYLGCNELQAKALGFSNRYEIVGKQAYEKLNDEDRAKLKHIDALVLQGEIVETEEVGVRENGEMGIFLTKKVPLSDATGNVTGILGISFDITEKKETEQLKIKNKIIEEKLATMRLLSASMAHEMRTPFASIKSIASVYKDYLPKLQQIYDKAKSAGVLDRRDSIDPAMFECLREGPADLEQITSSANLFIDMLLMKVNIEEHADEEEAPAISIKTVVENALSRYPFQKDERNLVHVDLSAEFSVAVNEMLIRHVLYNLLKNAIYYLKAAGKGEITIWLEQQKDKNLLHFKDTGQGIGPEDLAHLFEPFFSKTHHGTGIGLAYCKMIMRGIKGDITCQSQQGEYTYFILEFPKVTR